MCVKLTVINVKLWDYKPCHIIFFVKLGWIWDNFESVSGHQIGDQRESMDRRELSCSHISFVLDISSGKNVPKKMSHRHQFFSSLTPQPQGDKVKNCPPFFHNLPSLCSFRLVSPPLLPTDVCDSTTCRVMPVLYRARFFFTKTIPLLIRLAIILYRPFLLMDLNSIETND